MKILFIALFMAFTATQQDKPTCKGTTSKGIACKSTIVLKNGFCRVHNPDRVTCAATTAKGQPCKMVVTIAGDTCHVHQVKAIQP
jgi:hypothetical protein